MLILSLYTYAPAIRNDYTNLYIIEEEKRGEELDERKRNYLVYKEKERKVSFKINEHKTDKRYELLKDEDIDINLVKIIIRSIKLYPRKYLLRSQYGHSKEI